MKTDIKVGFQAAIRNATDATHAGHAMQILKGATYAMHAYEKLGLLRSSDFSNRLIVSKRSD